MSAAIEARRFLRAQHHGVLSTLSKKLDGYPFGSITPFVLDQLGRPMILISTLAEHTKNITADARVSLLAHSSADNFQANARVTVVGNCARLDDQMAPRARYLRFFPEAETYFDTHDFFFYRIEPLRIRYIGGFGAIHWVEADSFSAPANTLTEHEDAIIAHMNTDHTHNLLAYCQHYHHITAPDARMLGIDPDGFDVQAAGQTLRFEFDTPVLDAQSARKALVAMAQACRV